MSRWDQRHTGTVAEERPERTALGQKLLIAMVVGWIAIVASSTVIGSNLVALLLVAFMSLGTLAAVILVCSGLGLGKFALVFFVFAALVPGISFLLLLFLNGRATQSLREWGYTVGLLGASPPTGARDA